MLVLVIEVRLQCQFWCANFTLKTSSVKECKVFQWPNSVYLINDFTAPQASWFVEIRTIHFLYIINFSLSHVYAQSLPEIINLRSYYKFSTDYLSFVSLSPIFVSHKLFHFLQHSLFLPSYKLTSNFVTTSQCQVCITVWKINLKKLFFNLSNSCHHDIVASMSKVLWKKRKFP